MKNPIPHTAILASAGSGKTFQLAHRYLKLVASGVSPDRIMALTFSRKAAGEIFDSLFRYLCKSFRAKNDAGASLSTLRMLVDHLHRLQVGTLDSFCVSVVRAFPLELGLSLHGQVMDNDGGLASQARQEVMEELLAQHHVDTERTQEFLEAFKQATFGREEKGFDANLNRFVTNYQRVFRLLPRRDAWGSPSRIWSQRPEWMEEGADIFEVGVNLLNSFERQGLSDGQMTRWRIFIDAAMRFDPGSPWSAELNYLFEKLVEQKEALRAGTAHLTVDRKKQQLTAEQCRDVWTLVQHVVRTELVSALECTRGFYRLLEKYERLYDDMVIRGGRLTFEDILYVLSDFHMAEQKLLMDYRLDGCWDHWLLDEFQDTSDMQWAVLRAIPDEILQDTSGARSFFFVGDVKQSIYRWRGANAHLFDQLLRRYREVLQLEPLHKSFRSCKTIIDAVNKVFSKLPSSVPASVVQRWGELWVNHQEEQSSVPAEGYVALLEAHGDDKETAEARWRRTAEILNTLQPLERGLSTAVLARTNDVAKEVANYLRGHCPGITIVQEGRAALMDNPVVMLLLALVKFAAHPGDTLAWEHLQMSPLRFCFQRNRLSREDLPLQLLREIQQMGFGGFMRTWGRHLQEECPLDAFGKKRLRDLIHAACAFDEAQRDGDVNAFLRHIEHYEMKETATEGAVRVMTIHQSKGLGFDAVILPDLQTTGMASAGALDVLLARDDATQESKWVLKSPRRLVAELDSVLREQLQRADDEACFDELCLLYVALTRAKRGLYLVVNPPPKKSTSPSPALLVRDRLAEGSTDAVLYARGNADWFLAIQKRVPSESAGVSELRGKAVRASTRKILRQVLPSTQIAFEQNVGDFFLPKRRESLEVGVALHSFFEEITWIDEVDVSALLAAHKDKIDAFKLFSRALESKEIKTLLSKPAGNIELWRERSFEVVVDDEWITGTFDRVVIVRDAKGSVQRAMIVDYKSSDVGESEKLAEETARYRPQMEIYRRALAKLLGIDASLIEIKLVFAATGNVVAL